MSFADVLQMCVQIKCTGALIVKGAATESGPGPEVARFHFEGGDLRDATFGDQHGLEAVYAALALREGAFNVEAGARAGERRMFPPMGAILLEGMRRFEARPRRTPTSGPHLLAVTPAPDRFAPDAGEVTVAAAKPLMPPSSPASAPAPNGRRGLVTGLGVAAVALAALGVFLVKRAPDAPPTGVAVAAPAEQAPRATGPDPSQAAPVPSAAIPGAAAIPGLKRDEVVFGMAGPFSGPARELGRQMKQGIETAFGVVNEAGGVHGRRLRLVTSDDGYEPTRTLGAMKQLADEQHVFGVIGNVGTPTAAVAIPFALDRKMLFFGAFTGANLLRRTPPDRYVFNFRASYTEETAAVVNYLVRTRHIRPEHVAVFAQQDAFGDAGFAGVAKALHAIRPDLRPVLRMDYKRNTIDVDDALAHLRERASSVRAVVMVATYRAAAKFIEKARQAYPRMLFTNVSFVGGAALAEELMLLGPRFATGTIVTQVVPPVDSHSTAVLKYQAALARFVPGEKPDSVSLEGYSAANLLIEGLRRAGPNLDTERLVDALESIRGLDLGLGAELAFGPVEHQGSHKVWAIELDEAGHYHPLDFD